MSRTKIQLFLKKYRSFIIFSVIGVFVTLIDIAILDTLMKFFQGRGNVHAFALSQSISFAVSVVISFYLNSKYTFGEKHIPKEKFPLFMLVSAFAFCVNIIVSTITYKILYSYGYPEGVNIFFSPGVGAFVAGVLNYIGYYTLVFQPKEKDPLLNN